MQIWLGSQRVKDKEKLSLPGSGSGVATQQPSEAAGSTASLSWDVQWHGVTCQDNGQAAGSGRQQDGPLPESERV